MSIQKCPKLEIQLSILAMVLFISDQLAITIKYSQDGRQKIYIILYNLGSVCGDLLCMYTLEKDYVPS